MNHVRKMTVVPFENEDMSAKQEEAPVANTKTVKKKTGNWIKEQAQQRWMNIIELLYKLASIKAFDENGHILGFDGKYMSNTSISELITYAMTAGKAIVGEPEFVHQLKKANVSPERIKNENIKQKLLFSASKKEYKKVEPEIRFSEPSRPQLKRKRETEEYESSVPAKRKIEDSDDESPKRIKDDRWEYSDEDD